MLIRLYGSIDLCLSHRHEQNWFSHEITGQIHVYGISCQKCLMNKGIFGNRDVVFCYHFPLTLMFWCCRVEQLKNRKSA